MRKAIARAWPFADPGQSGVRFRVCKGGAPPVFLKNQWYVAAWSHEIAQAPLARRIAGEPIVLWRGESGQAVAFEDRCPHRLAPLSLGMVVGDALRCGYHGASFGPDGACTHVPGNPLPKDARVRLYPLVEKWGWAWLWLGEASRADPALLPDFHWQAEPGWAPIGGTLNFKAHYQLLLDNLLDLSHEAFLHMNTIGNAAVAEVPAHATSEGDHVRVTRLMPDCAPPPLFVKARGFTTTIDRLQDILFTPPCYITITVRATPAGTNDLSQALQWQVLNALTPETERSSHYFWGLPRHFLIEDRDIDQMLETAIVRTFNEDRAMLEAQQLVLAERSLDDRTLSTHADAGPSRARSIIARLLREERAAASA
jgi:phenylpropionate dioxygenase-like ring-hydroxylating dioxygenase large terminal subunit